MTRTDARRTVHDEGPLRHPSARSELERLLGLPYPELEQAVRDGTFDRIREASLAESRRARRVEE